MPHSDISLPWLMLHAFRYMHDPQHHCKLSYRFLYHWRIDPAWAHGRNYRRGLRASLVFLPVSFAGEPDGVESATVLELRGFMCVWAELKPRATWLEPAELCRQAPGCLSSGVISTATALHIYGSVLMPRCPHSHCISKCLIRRQRVKKENKENKGSINSALVVSCGCVKYYRWRLYWLYSSLSALNAFSVSCPRLTCMIG